MTEEPFLQYLHKDVTLEPVMAYPASVMSTLARIQTWGGTYRRSSSLACEQISEAKEITQP